jgi:uncharacterized protein GlcG (DUF336 family)
MAQTVAISSLAWTAAQTAARSAADKAAELGVAVNVSVVDAVGLPLAFARINGAPLHSISIAEDKAVTAVSFGLATGEWHDAVGGVPRVWDSLVARPRFCALAGGFPIRQGDAVVGGIGVSGGTEEQDVACASAGLAALGSV